MNQKRYAIVDAEHGTYARGKAVDVTRAIGAFVQRETGVRDPPTNLEWAALRTLAGTRPVIIPTRRGGAWLFIERITPKIYEIRVLAPTSTNRGRAKLVTKAELARIIVKTRAKARAAKNYSP